MKKRILFVIRDLRFGGIEKSLIEVLDILDYNKYDVELYLRSNNLSLKSYLNENVQLFVNETSQKETIVLRLLSAFSRLLHKLGFDYYSRKTYEIYKNKYTNLIENRQKKYFKSEYDVVVCYSQGYTARLVSDIVKAKKKICFFHESSDQYHKMNSKSFSYFDYIYTVNANVTDILKNNYPDSSSKFRTGFNYLNYEKVRVMADENVALPVAKTVLCTVGRFSQEKGFDIAVKCAKQLADKGIDFVWLFIGDGPEFDMIKAMVDDLNISDKIIFAGFQNNPFKYIKMADLYISPSRMESYPMTLLESAVLSVPIVSTKTEGGINFNDNIAEIKLCEINECDLSDAIIELLNNSDKIEFYTNSIKSIDWVEYKSGFVSLWENILN